MIRSRLTSKSQTTIPAPVRKALQLKEGDHLRYRIEQGRVILTRADGAFEHPFSAFTEWESQADCEAYGDF